jgi:hypothetical protein
MMEALLSLDWPTIVVTRPTAGTIAARGLSAFLRSLLSFGCRLPAGARAARET